MSFEREQLLGRVRGGFALLGQGSLGVPLLLLAMLGMMILPLPPFLLDLLFTFNIALSIIVLLVCVYALRPLMSPPPAWCCCTGKTAQVLRAR